MMNIIIRIILLAILAGIVYLVYNYTMESIIVMALLSLLIYIKRETILNALGECLEAGFRNKFPNDFVYSLSPALSYLASIGFHEVGRKGVGTDNPAVLLCKNGTTICVSLDAPLSGPYKYRAKDESETECLFNEIICDDIYSLVEKLKNVIPNG